MQNLAYNTAPAASDAFKSATVEFNNTYERRVLLCLLGETPAVITETLSLLLKEGIKTKGQAHAFWPKELVIITTGDGAGSLDDSFRKSLGNCLTDWGYTAKNQLAIQLHVISPHLSTGGEDEGSENLAENGLAYTLKEYNRPNSREKQRAKQKLDNVWNTYEKTPEGQGDVRTDRQTQYAANYLLDRVAKITQDSGSALHASIAGGRKSMGALLTQVMSLVGRRQDTISHVLTHKELQYGHQTAVSKKWAHQPWLKPSEPNQLVAGDTDKIFELSALEFVRLSAIYGSTVITIGKHKTKRQETYSDVVCRIQGVLSGDLTFLEGSESDMKGDGKGKFYLGDYCIELAPEPTAFLALLVSQIDHQLDCVRQSTRYKKFLSAYFTALAKCGDRTFTTDFLAAAGLTEMKNFDEFKSQNPLNEILNIARSHCDLLNGQLNKQGLGDLLKIGKVRGQNTYQIGLDSDRIRVMRDNTPKWLTALSTATN